MSLHNIDMTSGAHSPLAAHQVEVVEVQADRLAAHEQVPRAAARHGLVRVATSEWQATQHVVLQQQSAGTQIPGGKKGKLVGMYARISSTEPAGSRVWSEGQHSSLKGLEVTVTCPARVKGRRKDTRGQSKACSLFLSVERKQHNSRGRVKVQR